MELRQPLEVEQLIRAVVVAVDLVQQPVAQVDQELLSYVIQTVIQLQTEQQVHQQLQIRVVGEHIHSHNQEAFRLVNKG